MSPTVKFQPVIDPDTMEKQIGSLQAPELKLLKLEMKDF
jgi:hypothetical protein